MGQSQSQTSNPFDQGPSRRTVVQYCRDLSTYNGITMDMLFAVEQTKRRREHPLLAYLPPNVRNAFEEALQNIVAESNVSDDRAMRWLHRIWHLVHATNHPATLSPLSNSALNNLETMVFLRDGSKHSHPDLAVRAYALELRGMFADPRFAITEELMGFYARWLQCRDLSNEQIDIRYVHGGSFEPIVNPESARDRAIASLPRRQIEALVDFSEPVVCTICLEEVPSGTEVTVLEPFCRHWFHTGCIHTVFRSAAGTRRCPVCRAIINLGSGR